MSNELRTKLKEAAEAKLDVLLDECAKAVGKVAKGTGVAPADLAAMSFQKRSASMRKRSLVVLVNSAEAALLKQYNDQLDLPIAEAK